MEWRKSSYSGTETNCVEIGFDWRKSSYSTDQTNCVEVAYPTSAPTVGIRDSKSPASGQLMLPVTALHQLTRSITGS